MQYVIHTLPVNFVKIKDREQIPGIWIRFEGDDIYDVSRWTTLGEVEHPE